MSSDDIEPGLMRAHAALDAGDLDAARREARTVLDTVARAGEEFSGYGVGAELVLAEIDLALRRDRQVQERLDRIRRVAPDDPELAYLEGYLRLLQWQIDAAESRLRACSEDSAVGGSARYLRAVIAELRDDVETAERLYAEAAQLDPENHRRPVRIGDDEARALLREIVTALPDDVRAALDNVRIDIEPVPTASEHTDPFLLGLYEGVPIGESSGDVVAMPPRVRVFKRSIERLAGDRGELIEQLRITLLHEIGHHLGWDEDDLAERGLA